MSEKKVPVIIPGELELREFNHLACLRFHYHLPNQEKLPAADELFTGLTLEQAKDTVEFLQAYIQREETIRSAGSPNQKH